MSKNVHKSLNKLTKGAGIIFIGTATGAFLTFASKLIIIRYITKKEYGIFSIGLVLFGIITTVASLGLHQGTPRYIAYYKGKKDEDKVKAIAYSSIKIALIASLILALCLFISSNFISTNFFHNQELTKPLKIFSLAIPFLVLMRILLFIFRGFGQVKPQVYFENIIRHVLFVLCLGLVIIINLSYYSIIYAFVFATIFTCLAFVVYTFRKNTFFTSNVIKSTTVPDFTFKGFINKFKFTPLAKELLWFSLPVLGSSFLWQIMTWMDTLMLGYFKTSDIVGLYNGVTPLVRILPIILASFNFLYLPLISQYYASKQKEDIRKIYNIVAKWILMASLPIFLIFLFFPYEVLNFFFGARYLAAENVLRILSIGYFIITILGINAHTLTVMGRTKFIMWSILISVTINIICNILLIPPFGIIGAALATTISLFIIILLTTSKIYFLAKLHLFSMNNLKPILGSLIPICIIYALSLYFFKPIPFWLLPIISLLFLAIYILSTFLTKSVDKDDIMMIQILEKRAKIDFTTIKKVFEKFR